MPLFAAPLPDMKTDVNGRYLKFIAIPASPVPYGITAVFQILAYDEAYGFPETFTLSNPSFINL